MPIISIECRSGVPIPLKAKIADEITSRVQAVILSPLDLISVIFHELEPGNTYRSSAPTTETLIFCHIREGRSDSAVLNLAKGMSTAWCHCTGDSEDHVEVTVATYPAKFVVRGGQRLPEAPRV